MATVEAESRVAAEVVRALSGPYKLGRMKENFMRPVGLISLLVLTCATPAVAAELPSRKPGLWQVKTSVDSSHGPTQVILQCIDAATDQMMQSSAGPFAPAACPGRDVHVSENSITIDSTCSIGGKAATAHSVVTGSFDGAYTMTVASQGDVIPGGRISMTMEGKWLGPCTAEQKPGDMILANGMKLNLPELQKHSGLPGLPLPSR